MNRLALIPLLSALFMACGSSNNICTTTTELTDRDHLVSLTPLRTAPELLDTLAKYPQLQVVRLFDDNYTVGVFANVYFDGLLSFTDTYRLYKSKRDGSVSSPDRIPSPPNLSHNARITYTEAIRKARQVMEFDSLCISYRLGFFATTPGSNIPSKYSLAWKIQGANGFPYLILDANSGDVLQRDTGIRY
ncbi:MAG TPA: hypothetical protein VL633_05775 [Bacteroidota bacterium]|jgi:hypothetical protein|nr:hypothetical protein [Bacteroidota bacterium]